VQVGELVVDEVGATVDVDDKVVDVVDPVSVNVAALL